MAARRTSRPGRHRGTRRMGWRLRRSMACLELESRCLMSLSSFLQIFIDVCLPIFVSVGLGWALDRRFRLHLESLVKLNIYLMVPAFIFTRVMDTELSGHDA